VLESIDQLLTFFFVHLVMNRLACYLRVREPVGSSINVVKYSDTIL